MNITRPIYLLLIAALLSSCVLPVPALPFFASPTPSITPTATLTPTPPPTPTPRPTPTPAPQAFVSLGEQALQDGDWDLARREFTNALNASDPETLANAQIGLARVALAQARYAESLNLLRPVSQDENLPAATRARAFYFLGKTFTSLYRYQEAAAAYLGYSLLQPGLLDSYLYELAGDAYTAAQDPESARNAYQTALLAGRAQSTENLQFKLAAAYAQTNDTATALVLYDDLYNTSPNEFTRAQTRLLAGNLLIQLGNRQAGLNAYAQAVNNAPRAYDSYTALIELVNANYPVNEFQRGLVDYYAAQYGVAQAAFDRYLLAPENDLKAAEARYYRALAMRARNDLQGALKDWQTLIEKYPQSPLWDDAYQEIGYTQWAYQNDYESGIQTFLDFVEAAPAHERAPEFLDFAARVAERGGLLDFAASIWERVASEYSGSLLAQYALFQSGIIYYRQENYGFALGAFQGALNRAISLNERAAALLWLGKAYQAQGRTQEAQELWQQAAALDPTDYYSLRARQLLNGGTPFSPPLNYDLSKDPLNERALAEDWLRTAFALNPDDDLAPPAELFNDPRWARGNELWILGEYETARAEFESLRADFSANPVANFHLAARLSELGAYRTAIFSARRVLDLAGLDDNSSLRAPIWFNRIRYGAYYSNLVLAAAQENNLHPLFLWSVMRQESLFEGFVRSSAGARGLMQIMPATGEEIARRTNLIADFSPEDLYRPMVSIRFGAHYLAQQRDYFGGDLTAALAAYNAGPGNAAIWKNLANNDPDLLVEIIRFEETRRYVKQIYEIYSIYLQLYER